MGKEEGEAAGRHCFISMLVCWLFISMFLSFSFFWCFFAWLFVSFFFSTEGNKLSVAVPVHTCVAECA